MKSNNHEGIIGGSRSGKTFSELKRVRGKNIPVLFFNPQFEEAGGFVECTPQITDRAIRQELLKGVKINFMPSEDKKVALKQLEVLVDILKHLGKQSVIICDEVDEYGRQGMSYSPAFWVAQRGARFGITGHFITQDPARADKIILKNCFTMRIHRLNNFGKKYIENLYPKEDYQKILGLLGEAGQYNYVYIENGEIKGVEKD